MAKKTAKVESGEPVTARVLSDGPIGGQTYRCNDVVRLSSALAEAHIATGTLDVHPDAVSYARDELGAKVIEHPADEEG